MIEQRSCCVLALPGVTEIELGAYFYSGLRSCLHASGDDPPFGRDWPSNGQLCLR